MSSSVKQFAFLFWSSPSSCAQMERKVGSLIKKLFAELWGEFREINKRHVRPLGLGTLENSVKQWENRPSNRENISAAHSPKVQGKETVTKWERGRGAGRVEQSVAALHNPGWREGLETNVSILLRSDRVGSSYWLSQANWTKSRGQRVLWCTLSGQGREWVWGLGWGSDEGYSRLNTHSIP